MMMPSSYSENSSNQCEEDVGAVTFFVSCLGDDRNPGTKDAPFATLDKAQHTVRAAKHKAVAPIRVYVREGTYFLKEPLQFTAEDSGSDEVPIFFEAFENERVVISGGTSLKLAWTYFRDGIWQASVPEDIEIDELFVNEKRYWMARYPNYDPTVSIYNGYSSDCLNENRIAGWSDPSDGYIHAMHKHMWGGYHYLITGKDPNDKLTYEGGWQNNRPLGMHDEYRFVENIFEELDAPGEWYLDRRKNILYVYPIADTDLQNAVVEAAQLRHLIEFAGTEALPVCRITLKGFTFRHTSRSFMDTREPLLRSDWTIYRGGAIFFEGSKNCHVEDCFLDQLGGNAIFVSGFNREISVRGCHIANAGANGIAFVGQASAVRSPLFEYNQRQKLKDIDQTPGPLTNEYPADCLVEDCLIYRSGRYEKQSAPIQISMSQNITIRHCSIYEVPRAGINISDGTWGGHLIECNDVFDTVLETGDHGSFNSWGRDRFWGLEDVDLNHLNLANEKPEPSELPILDTIKPVIIRNNRWRCDHGWDIDLDDGSSNYHIYNNLCLSGGIKLREGFYRKCENNIIVHNSFHPHVWYKGSQDIFRNNIVFETYKPILVPQPWGLECDNNLLHRNGENVVIPANSLQQQSERDSNSIIGDAKFINPDIGDYRVVDDSPALEIEFNNFPMDLFGVYKEEYRQIARTPELPKPVDFTASTRDGETYEWMGVQIRNVTGIGEVSAFGLPGEIGVWIETAPEESELVNAGLQEKDVIIEIAGYKIGSLKDILNLNIISKGEKPIKISIFRDQQILDIQIVSHNL
ncbi:peptide-binding protein [Bacillus sp. J14TS2]|uniref:PDZ domain-containing protein n=1 Tax=Bacillus sp. J14TS2 TaxID=2807188 RepID=UPI001B1F25C7|nr:PDZ domain-containing protein [Bacillus sp. J14TS2]GIN72495.1 peptide-binding protein [Bacillus sp. J14TS2]